MSSVQPLSPIPGKVMRRLEFVARVAEAMFRAEHPNASWNAGRARAIWWTRAEAAIRGMREPTVDMLKAAERAMSPGHRPRPEFIPSRQKHRHRWQTMIDAASGMEEA